MRASDDNGVELNAEYSVKAESEGLALIRKSAGGRVAGSSRPRNDEYAQALTLLLERLRERDGVLETVVVDSRNVGDLPESERRLINTPIELAHQRDMAALRLRLTGAQGRIGQRVGSRKARNARKRIRLRLTVPGYGPGAARRLESDLAKPTGVEQAHTVRLDRPRAPEEEGPTSPNATHPDALQLLRSLMGVEIFTVKGSPNRILSVDSTTVQVATDRSPSGRPVPVADVQAGLTRLTQQRSVRVNIKELGHRSAFVGAVLAILPGTVVTTGPATITLHQPADLPIPTDVQFGILDGTAEVKIRKEQGLRRRLLAGDRTTAECVCWQPFPMEFLVAAHIKRRAMCSEQERHDLHNVAMLVCAFGCDRLYELRYVTVDQGGMILTVPLEDSAQDRFTDHLRWLQGRRCTAHRAESEPYFAWHRDEIYLGRHSPHHGTSADQRRHGCGM